jgi:hypothetical protein
MVPVCLDLAERESLYMGLQMNIGIGNSSCIGQEMSFHVLELSSVNGRCYLQTSRSREHMFMPTTLTKSRLRTMSVSS